LINNAIVPIPGITPLAAGEVVKNLQKFTKKIEVIDANGICQKELGTPVVSGIYLLCLAAFKKMLPLEPEFLREAIKESVAPKYLELNIKTWEAARGAQN
jgi:Pyruvate/2-oxoacid:ferredoxin oxidoreductase gamma subunit